MANTNGKSTVSREKQQYQMHQICINIWEILLWEYDKLIFHINIILINMKNITMEIITMGKTVHC